MRRAPAAGIALLTAAVGLARPALAEEPEVHGLAARQAPEAPSRTVVVWPTVTPAGDDASATPLHKPTSLEEPLAARAHELDATLRDATQDLGFVLDLSDLGPSPGRLRDLDMIARAGRASPGEPAGHGTWVVSARLEQVGTDSFVLRIVAVPPNGKELRVRVETVKGPDVSVRGLVLLRDLLSPVTAAEAESGERERERVDLGASRGVAAPSRSPGRAVLAVNGALFGGYVGYSLELASGSDDPRVLYPLLALGAAVGIGGALLAAEEWDITTGDAWYLSAGAWWGAGSGLLLANGVAVPQSARYAWGIGGGFAGLSLATFARTRTKMDDGDAVLTHSGAGVGFWIGALTELGYRGTTKPTPNMGAGLGSAIGLVGAGTAAVFLEIPPSRVLLVDLGFGLGTLAGAAAGSPLIFGNLTADKTRWFLAGTVVGGVAGGTAGWFLTRDPNASKKNKKAMSPWLQGMPTAGIIGESVTRSGSVPAYGVAYSGQF